MDFLSGFFYWFCLVLKRGNVLGETCEAPSTYETRFSEIDEVEVEWSGRKGMDCG